MSINSVRNHMYRDNHWSFNIGSAAQSKVSAHTDLLTGLGNEARLLKRMEGLTADTETHANGYSVAIVDIRGFKPINVMFGAEAGDTILAQIAVRLRSALDKSMYVARLGNDVFGVLMPNISTETEAKNIAQLFVELLTAPYDIGMRSVHLSCCIGIALDGGRAKKPAEILAQAVAALVLAKERGYGEICIHSAEVEQRAQHIIGVENALHHAIANEAIDVHFQPIVCMQRNCLGGFEALARWNDPVLGFVPPIEFIEIAERRGYIYQLFRTVLDKSLTAAKNWPDQLFVAVNLSPSQMVDANTSRVILEALDKHRFDPKRLEIEITESAIISNRFTADKIIADLKAAGIKLSLDDFGTGQSSLNRLRQMPFDKLKIDRSFVASVAEDPTSETIVRAILEMCKGLNIRVIAEGIETPEQAAKMVMLGCHGFQGYLFGKPVNAQDTLDFIARNAHFCSAGSAKINQAAVEKIKSAA